MPACFLPALEAAGRSDVVNIVSVAGTVAFAPSGPYSASKHAQLAFSRATAAELRGAGIRVHTVNPGFVETEGFPQESALRSPIFRRLVVGPDASCARLSSTYRARQAGDVRPALVPRVRDRAGARAGRVRPA